MLPRKLVRLQEMTAPITENAPLIAHIQGTYVDLYAFTNLMLVGIGMPMRNTIGISSSMLIAAFCMNGSTITE